MLGLPERGEAGADLAAIQQHGAGAAVARIASDLGAGQAELVAQYVGQPGAARRRGAHAPAVDLQLDDVGKEICARPVHAGRAAWFNVRRTSVSAASRRYSALART